jgi:hypothetical protein
MHPRSPQRGTRAGWSDSADEHDARDSEGALGPGLSVREASRATDASTGVGEQGGEPRASVQVQETGETRWRNYRLTLSATEGAMADRMSIKRANTLYLLGILSATSAFGRKSSRDARNPARFVMATRSLTRRRRRSLTPALSTRVDPSLTLACDRVLKSDLRWLRSVRYELFLSTAVIGHETNACAGSRRFEPARAVDAVIKAFGTSL